MLELRHGGVSAALHRGTKSTHAVLRAEADVHATTRLGAEWDTAAPGEAVLRLRHKRPDGDKLLGGWHVNVDAVLCSDPRTCVLTTLQVGREFAVNGGAATAAATPPPPAA